MKQLLTLCFLFFGASQVFAGPCADAYNKAVGNSEVFSFNDEGDVQVSVDKKDRIIINEKKARTHRLVVKSNGRRANYLVRYTDGRISSINTGINNTISFGGSECQKLQQAMDENTRSKIETAVDAAKVSKPPAH